ncbi:TorF family putative porin [Prevotella sp. 10(H)]|uniref:TorF family putative porin n=1 Tax=Prevotella sp. 10(H) TaxID=1158294 RepID=UPI0004A6E1B5|nr:TorF family putative porin [Prevotella sp. 10(H)]
MKISDLSKKVCSFIILFISFPVIYTNAQSTLEVDLGADLVSSYVWRGVKQAGASVQPSLSASINGFSLSAWGSTDFTGNDGKKEVDFTAAFENSGFKIAVTDYWWDGEGAHRYFSYPQDGNSGHMLEGTIGYTFPDSFPLSITWNTFFLGKGNKKADGDNSYSTYIELAYPFSVKGVDMGIATGFSPWENATLGIGKGFKVTSVMLNASKSIKITDSFSLPIFANIIANPAVEDIHFVFGISIRQ